MPQPVDTIVKGEFDHTKGVYRLIVEVPLNVVIALDTQLYGSTAETMLWIGELIKTQAQKLIESERSGPKSGGNI